MNSKTCLSCHMNNCVCPQTMDPYKKDPSKQIDIPTITIATNLNEAEDLMMDILEIVATHSADLTTGIDFSNGEDFTAVAITLDNETTKKLQIMADLSAIPIRDLCQEAIKEFVATHYPKEPKPLTTKQSFRLFLADQKAKL